jgi:hypothetical protein
MKNLFNNISQEEKNRILEMHSAKKNVIFEQGQTQTPGPATSPFKGINQQQTAGATAGGGGTNQSGGGTRPKKSGTASVASPKKITEDMAINLYLEPNQTQQPENYEIAQINLKKGVVEFILDDEDKLSSPKLIFKCGSDDLIMVTQIDLTKKVYNKELLAVLKNQFCMKNSKGIIVPKAHFAVNNTQTDPTTGVA